MIGTHNPDQLEPHPAYFLFLLFPLHFDSFVRTVLYLFVFLVWSTTTTTKVSRWY